MSTTLIVPGLHDSGPDHWQSWIEVRVPNPHRVMQENWSEPNLSRWTANVRRAIAKTRDDIFVVAHSFGCLAAVLAGAEQPDRIGGMLLVAPADPDKFGIGNLMPRHDPGFRTIVVASRNDPWLAFAEATTWATRWRASLIDAGYAGHINAAAGFGAWPQGLELVQRLLGGHTDQPHFQAARLATALCTATAPNRTY